jgi:hypothetical protein
MLRHLQQTFQEDKEDFGDHVRSHDCLQIFDILDSGLDDHFDWNDDDPDDRKDCNDLHLLSNRYETFCVEE